MFEIGKSYSFTIDDQSGIGTASYKVIAWEAPLLRLSSVNEPDLILNTASHRFLSAAPVNFDASAPIAFKIAGLEEE